MAWRYCTFVCWRKRDQWSILLTEKMTSCAWKCHTSWLILCEERSIVFQVITPLVADIGNNDNSTVHLLKHNLARVQYYTGSASCLFGEKRASRQLLLGPLQYAIYALPAWKPWRVSPSFWGEVEAYLTMIYNQENIRRCGYTGWIHQSTPSGTYRISPNATYVLLTL